MLSCRARWRGGGEGRSNKQGVGVPDKYLKMVGWGCRNKMILGEYWDYTIKWGGWGGYDFYISGSFLFYRKWLIQLYYFWNWCVFCKKKGSKINRIQMERFVCFVFCSLIQICSVCVSNMIMIVYVQCSFLIWFSPMILISRLKVLLRSFIKWGGGD